MSVVLLILKIIGIAILAVVSLALLVVLLVLFVPVRYFITAEKYEEKDFLCIVKATWLLHFVNITVKYLNELYYKVRITIIPIIKSDNLRKKKKIKKSNKETNNVVTSDSLKGPEVVGNKLEKVVENNVKNNGDETKQNNDDTNINLNNDDELEKSFFEKIVLILEKIFEFLINIKENMVKGLKKVQAIYEDIDYYLEAINDERNIEAFKLVKDKVLKVLKHLAPKKIEGNIHFGSTDPYNIGKMMSIYGILFPIIHDKIQVVPNYEKNIIEGNLILKGRIRIVTLLWAAFKIYFNKDVRRMIKVFNKV